MEPGTVVWRETAQSLLRQKWLILGCILLGLVGASVFAPGGGDYPDAASMLTAIEDAVDECLADAEKGDYGDATSEPISELPEGAVGFRFTSTSSDPVEVGSIAFAETDDGRLVGVGVTHSGDGEASVDVADLLSTALERAADVDTTS